jgi:hypothetical protein
MFQRILLAYDGSAASQRALIDSDAVAKMTGARVHLVAVVPEPTAHLAFEAGMLDMPDPAEQRGHAKRRLDSGMTLLRDHGFEVSGEVLFGGTPSQPRLARTLVEQSDFCSPHRTSALQRARIDSRLTALYRHYRGSLPVLPGSYTGVTGAARNSRYSASFGRLRGTSPTFR